MAFEIRIIMLTLQLI